MKWVYEAVLHPREDSGNANKVFQCTCTRTSDNVGLDASLGSANVVLNLTWLIAHQDSTSVFLPLTSTP